MRGTEGHWHETLQDYFADPNGPNDNELAAQGVLYFYNYENIIEKNVITDVHKGGYTFWNDANSISNGVFYSTGGTFERTNFCRKNYFHTLDPGNTQGHYQDDFTSGLNIEQNFVTGTTTSTLMWDMNNFDRESVNLGADSTNVLHQMHVTSNIVANSTFNRIIFTSLDGIPFTTTEGNLVFSTNNYPGAGPEVGPPHNISYTGEPSKRADYEEMYNILCSTDVGHDPTLLLPGQDNLRTLLGSKITEFGGTPACSGTQFSLATSVNGQGSISLNPAGGTYAAVSL